MSARSKLHRLCVFMTPTDEAQFSDALRARLPSVMFVDSTEQGVTPTPNFQSSLSACAGHHVTIVDTSIVSEAVFHRDDVVDHPSGQGWTYALVGTGLVSLVRWNSAGSGLRNWELRASVPAGDGRTADFVRDLMRVARDGGTKVFAIDPQTRTPAQRAERNFVAWPDAAVRYGAQETAQLNNGPTAWFTVER